jgi:DNA repair exonuclease SbcCD ATPase subunit
LDKIRPALDIQKDIDTIRSLEIEITTLQRRKTLIERAKAIDEKVAGLKSIVGDLTELKNIFMIQTNAKRLDDCLHRVETIETATGRYREEYDELKKRKITMLKGVKECPVFNLSCPVVKQMAEKVEKGL